MSFWEKGYLATAAAILVAVGVYAYLIWQRSLAAGYLVAPDAVSFVTYAVAIVVLSGLAFILIASRDAMKSEHDGEVVDGFDERDKLIGHMANGQAHHVTSFGLYLSLLAFIVHGSGNILFYSALGALAIGEIAMCLLRVLHYNRAI
jgi:hypothetical protein